MVMRAEGGTRATAALVLGAVAAAIGPAAPAPAAAADPQILSAADRVSFARLEASLGGRSGIAVVPGGLGATPVRMGTLRTSVAWSTSKVPVAMAVIAGGGGAAQRTDLRRAITASDNAAAERLFASLGSPSQAAEKATAQLRAAGDRRTVVESRRLRGAGFTAFGQTAWRLTDQARVAAGMVCTDPGRQVLDLMGDVIAADRWGLGATKATAQLKGGWGPGTKPGAGGGYVDRQMGVLALRGRSFAVAIATAPADGGHDTGTAHLTRIARWLVAHADVRRLPANARCG
jgi:hypothetical protein